MMTVKELEAACNRSLPLDFSVHCLEAPALSLRKMFYPMGFPAEVRTNEPEILTMMAELWPMSDVRHDTKPFVTHVHVVEGSGSGECPPTPIYRLMMPIFLSVADGDNYSIVDVEQTLTRISMARTTLRYPLYAKYFLLGTPGCCIATRLTTTIHAGCVSLHGRGVLLCGDTGAGKSTLSYACARAGWTFVSDDGSYVINDGAERTVTGEHHRVRFRPTAAELFPEIRGLDITPRAAGKPSIELLTSSLPGITSAPTARADFLVFLNRSHDGPPELVPYRKDVAREFIRQGLFGIPESLAKQYKAIEALLAGADVFEMRYTDLDWAIARLTKLVEEGR